MIVCDVDVLFCISHPSSCLHSYTVIRTLCPLVPYNLSFLCSIVFAWAVSIILICTQHDKHLAAGICASVFLLRRTQKLYYNRIYTHFEFIRVNRIKRLTKWDDFVTYSIGDIVIIAITFDIRLCVCVSSYARLIRSCCWLWWSSSLTCLLTQSPYLIEFLLQFQSSLACTTYTKRFM